MIAPNIPANITIKIRKPSAVIDDSKSQILTFGGTSNFGRSCSKGVADGVGVVFVFAVEAAFIATFVFVLMFAFVFGFVFVLAAVRFAKIVGVGEVFTSGVLFTATFTFELAILAFELQAAQAFDFCELRKGESLINLDLVAVQEVIKRKHPEYKEVRERFVSLISVAAKGR